MPDVRVGVMLLLCRASENELVSHHKNIQEGTSSWNLSTPRSCYAGSNRQSEEAKGAGECLGGGGPAVVCICAILGVCVCVLLGGLMFFHEHMVLSVFISNLRNQAEFL